MNIYKIGVWGTLGMHGLLLKYVFFVYCVIKRMVDHVPALAVKQE